MDDKTWCQKMAETYQGFEVNVYLNGACLSGTLRSGSRYGLTLEGDRGYVEVQGCKISSLVPLNFGEER